MPITSSNPFKGRHFPGEVILVCVRWYLRDLSMANYRIGRTRRGVTWNDNVTEGGAG